MDKTDYNGEFDDSNVKMELETNGDRKEFMERVKEGHFLGKNQEGENIIIIVGDGMEIRTKQSNHWIRVNYFDSDGAPEGETFNGRWS